MNEANVLKVNSNDTKMMWHYSDACFVNFEQNSVYWPTIALVTSQRLFVCGEMNNGILVLKQQQWNNILWSFLTLSLSQS